MKKRFYITGTAGTGKSTVSKALNERGVASFDIGSVSGLTYWRNKVTKEKTAYDPKGGKKFLDTHEYICDEKKLKELLDGPEEVIVITGLAGGNQDRYLHLFDKVFLLQCSPETLVYRLRNRDTNVFGKNPEEEKIVLEFQKRFDSRLASEGACPVSTEGSVEDVVGELTQLMEL